jgi:hypothetical protein
MISETDRARIGADIALALAKYGKQETTYYALGKVALDAALSAGLADAIREQALREAAQTCRALSPWEPYRTTGPKHCAAAIEALIGKPAPAPKGET